MRKENLNSVINWICAALACFALMVSMNADLSGISADELRFAVLSDDVKTISKAPGIGKKTAQKMILELKDKLAKGQLAASGETYGGTGVTVIPENKSSEAAAALAVLGYSQNEIAAALKGLDMEQLKLEEIVKHALKKMVK